MGTQKTHLIETILLSTHNIGLADKIRILEQAKHSLSRALFYSFNQIENCSPTGVCPCTVIRYRKGDATRFSFIITSMQLVLLQHCFSFWELIFSPRYFQTPLLQIYCMCEGFKVIYLI